MGVQEEAAEELQGILQAQLQAHDTTLTRDAAVQWVAIKETDDEKTRARKKKLQKSFKSKQRFQEMDKQTQKKQQSWLDFKSGKGAKKKVLALSAPPEVAAKLPSPSYDTHRYGGVNRTQCLFHCQYMRAAVPAST